MDRDRWDRGLEIGILGLILIILVQTPLATGSVRPQDFLFSQWLVIPAALLWLVRLWLRSATSERAYFPPVCWAVCLFVLYAVVRYWTADLEYVARQELMRILVYALMFFMLIDLVRSPRLAQVIGLVVVALATAISFYAIYQFATNSNMVWHFERPDLYAKRGSGTFINPNHLAGYLEMVLPLAMAYTLMGRFRPVTRIMTGYAALAIFGGLLVTVSRAGWVAAAVSLFGLLLALIIRRSSRVPAIIILALLVAGSALFVVKASFSSNRNARISVAGHTEDVRFLLWPPARTMWVDHIWWGVGPAHFDYRFPQYRPAHRDLQSRPNRVHNDYLNTLVDWGVVGGLLVAAVWALFFWAWATRYKSVRLAQDDPENLTVNLTPFYIGGAFGLGAILIHSLGDFNMHIPSNAILAVTLLAVITGLFRLRLADRWSVPGPVWRVLATVMILGLIVFMGRNNWRLTQEQFWLLQAAKRPNNSDRQIEALKRAFEAEPANHETAYRIGSCYRIRSWQGLEGYEQLAKTALEWFRKSSDINPFDAQSQAQQGMCLDWIGDKEAAQAFFDRAHELDPNGYYVTALIGWHHLNARNYEESKKWLERSIELYSANNIIAAFYLRRVKEEMAREPER